MACKEKGRSNECDLIKGRGGRDQAPLKKKRGKNGLLTGQTEFTHEPFLGKERHKNNLPTQ